MQDELNNTTKINKDSFEKLYFQYSEKMLSVCLKYSGDYQLSIEIIQEVFLSIWERKDLLVIQGNPEKYLIRAAKLNMLAHFRNYKRRSQLQASICNNNSQQENTTELDVQFKETLDKINTIANQQLSKSVYEVFQLEQNTQLTNQQIAQITHLSLATINNYLSKASILLHKNIKKNI